MRVYIAADLEGIGGIWGRRQIEEYWPEVRTLFTREVNAAVEGALEGGATDVVVWDNHDGGTTFLVEELHEQAQLIMGTPHMPRFPCLDEGFGGVYLVGYHAMSGTEAGVLDHTYSSSSFRSVSINGREMGEVEMDALWAGIKGVPVLLVTGDDKVCKEALSFLGPIETAVVKWGVHRQMARLLSPKQCRRLVREKAKAALGKVAQASPFTVEPPYVKEVRFSSTELADDHAFTGPSIARVSGDTVQFRGDDLAQVLSMW